MGGGEGWWEGSQMVEGKRKGGETGGGGKDYEEGVEEGEAETEDKAVTGEREGDGNLKK